MAQNGAREETLTAKQRTAIGMIVLHGNVSKSAIAAGVGRRTLCRWLQEPKFRDAVANAEREAFGHAMRQLTGLAAKAIDTVAEIVQDRESAGAVRLRAALGVLDHAIRWREQVDLEERVAALEKTMRYRK